MTNPDRSQPNNEGDEVGEHVIWVTDESQGVWYVAKCEFNNEEGACESYHGKQTACSTLQQRHLFTCQQCVAQKYLKLKDILTDLQLQASRLM